MLRKGKISKTLNFRGKVNVATDRLKFLKSHERWLGTKQGPEYDPHKNIMAQTGPAHKKLSQGLLDRAMSKRKSGIAVGLRILSWGPKDKIPNPTALPGFLLLIARSGRP